MKRGFQIYWPACQQGPVDFLVEREDGHFDRVQVKTAGWNQDWLQCKTRLPKGVRASDLYDYLFIVSDRGNWEIPAHTITKSKVGLDNRTGHYWPRGTDYSPYKIKET